MATGSMSPTEPRRRWATVLRSPVAHFVVIGVLLFAADRRWRATSADRGGEARHGRESISLTGEDIARVRRQWTAQHWSPPDADEEDRMIARAVEEEML